MKVLLTLTTTLLLAACSTTRVHVFTEGLVQSELARLQTAIQDSGFEPVLNSRPVPPEVKRPTLVYSPYHDNHQHIEQLDTLLAEHGYQIDLVPVSIGNNFYTANNVGLYLKPGAAIARATDVADSVDGPALPADRLFNGECPAVDAYLLLTATHTFTLDILGWNDSLGKETTSSYSGTWQQHGDVVQLSTATLDVAFRQMKEEEHVTIRRNSGDIVVAMSLTRLLNSGNAFSACNFVLRERVQL